VVAGRGGVAGDAGAVVLNVTVTQPQGGHPPEAWRHRL
jgi:hypothetical protein